MRYGGAEIRASEQQREQPYLELTAPFEPILGAFLYLGVGTLVSWDPRRNRTTLILEVGGRAWLGGRRFFTDVGFGAAPGRWDLAVWTVAFPHLQVGVAFWAIVSPGRLTSA